MAGKVQVVEQNVKRKKIISVGTSADATVVKSKPTLLHGLSLINTNAAARFLKLHDIATTPVAGTTPVEMVVCLPPNVPVNFFFDQPTKFVNGLGYTLVTTAPDNGATAVAANEITGTLFYI